MKNNFLVFSLIIFWSSLFSQQEKISNECLLYVNILQDTNFSENIPVLVEFDYELPDSLKKILTESYSFDFNQFEKGISNFKSNECPEITEALVKNRTLNNSKGIDKYKRVNISKPFRINEFKVYFFVERVTIMNGRGIIGGGILLNRFEFSEGTWENMGAKILEMY